mmetsp:Transcript_75782/g.214244  ORF Transcript_75782/g.214244 Transcript_75782/m.214244 type:complete len:478 (+) Transcript_75782:63-1496(+)
MLRFAVVWLLPPRGRPAYLAGTWAAIGVSAALLASGGPGVEAPGGGGCHGWGCYDPEQLPPGLAARDGESDFCDFPVLGAGDVAGAALGGASLRLEPFVLRGTASVLEMQAALGRDRLLAAGRRKGLSAHFGHSWDIVMHRGHGPRKVSLERFITKVMHADWHDGEERLERAYSFDGHSGVLSLEGVNLEIPPMVESWNYSAFTPTTAKPIFLVGGPGSGVGFHRHAAALQMTAHGWKRWFLYHPADNPPGGVHGGWPILDWLHRVYPALRGRWAPRECIQKPGDVIYVPEGWYHAVVNLADSVGVSLQRHDFMVESVRLEFEAKHVSERRKQGKLWRRVARLEPGNLEAKLQLFRSTVGSRPKQALRELTEALQSDPFLVDAQYALASHLAGQHAAGSAKALKSLASALHAWKPYLENNTRNLQANHLLSQFHLLAGAKEEGIAYLRRNVVLQELGIRDERLPDVEAHLQRALQQD